MPDLLVHATLLAREHGIDLQKTRRRGNRGGSSGAKAYPAEQRVVTYGINGQRDYFTALHEIGHCVCLHSGSVRGARLLEVEAEAWDWALQNAVVVASSATKQHIGDCLKQYGEGTDERPAADHIYHRMLRWAKPERTLRERKRLP